LHTCTSTKAQQDAVHFLRRRQRQQQACCIHFIKPLQPCGSGFYCPANAGNGGHLGSSTRAAAAALTGCFRNYTPFA
jgi:hypothetical protein